MTALVSDSAYGALTAPDTLTIQRVLPGPIDRVWRYLTEGEMRRRWLAAGDMTLEAGASFTLTWRNDELTDPPGVRPEGFSAEHSAECRITEVDPPRKLAYDWPGVGAVCFELESRGERVLMTLTHSRIPNANVARNVAPGWHAHLEILVARLSGETPASHWETWTRLKAEYDARLPTA